MFPTHLLKKVAARLSYEQLRDKANGRSGPSEPKGPDKARMVAKLMKQALH